MFEACVGEGLFEGYAVDEEGVLQGAAGDFFDANELFVEVVLVEGEDCIDGHYQRSQQKHLTRVHGYTYS